MLKSFAETVQHHLIQTYPDNKSYSLSELLGPSIPHPIAHFLKRALHQRVQEIDLEIYPDWIDYENEDVKQKTEDWRRYLLKHARFPESVWEQTLRQAIRLVISYLIQPSLTLTKFVFGSEYGESDLKMAKERMSFFNAYPEFNRAVDEYILTTGSERVARQDFSDLLAEVDRQVAESLADQAWIDKLDGLYNIAESVPIMENSVSNDILLLLFDQKGRHDLARLVEKDAQEAYTRSELLQLLRSDYTSDEAELIENFPEADSNDEYVSMPFSDEPDDGPSYDIDPETEVESADLSSQEEEAAPPFMNLIKGSGLAIGSAGLASHLGAEKVDEENLQNIDPIIPDLRSTEEIETPAIDELPRVVDERSSENPGFVRRDIIESDIDAVEEEAERLGRRAPLPEDDDDLVLSEESPLPSSFLPDQELSETESTVREEPTESLSPIDESSLVEDNIPAFGLPSESDQIVLEPEGQEEINDDTQKVAPEYLDNPSQEIDEYTDEILSQSVEQVDPSYDNVESEEDLDDSEPDPAEDQEIIHRHEIIPPIPIVGDVEDVVEDLVVEQEPSLDLTPDSKGNPFIAAAESDPADADAIPLWKKYQMEETQAENDLEKPEYLLENPVEQPELIEPISANEEENLGETIEEIIEAPGPETVGETLEESFAEEMIEEEMLEEESRPLYEELNSEVGDPVDESSQTVLEKLTNDESKPSLHESFIQEEQARFEEDQSRLSPEERVLGNIHASRRAWYIYHLFGGDEISFKRFLSEIDSAADKNEKMHHLGLLVESKASLGMYSAPVIAIREQIFGESE